MRYKLSTIIPGSISHVRSNLVMIPRTQLPIFIERLNKSSYIFVKAMRILIFFGESIGTG